jgi:hypothetical protein
LDRWRHEGDEKLVKKRAAVFAKLREQLLSPQPPARKVRKAYKHATEWKVGELVAYKMNSGCYAIFRVIGYHADKGGRYSIVEVLDWVGETVPSKNDLKGLPIRQIITPKPMGIPSSLPQLLLIEPRPGQRGKDRIVELGMKTKRKQKPTGGIVCVWGYWDKILEDAFGIT